MVGGIVDAILLVAMALGYIVCYLANREEKTLRLAGYLIGIFIILLSAMLIVNNLVLNLRFCEKKVSLVMP